MKNDQHFMQLALEEARKGLGRASPNPAVGAVLVKNGRVIATGFHKKTGGPHAEIEALRLRSGRDLRKIKGATMYVTLEPCCHFGRTPPCTDAMIRSGIKEVVIGMRDPDPRVSGKGIRILKQNGIRVRMAGAEMGNFYAAYLKHRRTGLPFVTLKVAATLDGMVASKTGLSSLTSASERCPASRWRPLASRVEVGTAAGSGRPRWITGEGARSAGHDMRDRCDAILVGIGTIRKDNPRLTTRLKKESGPSTSLRAGHDPIRIVLDSRLRIPENSKILKLKSPSPTWIVTAVKLAHPKISRIQKRGVEILFGQKDSKGRIDLKRLLHQLGKRGILSLLVEGGPRVWASFLRQGLVDHMVLFLAPDVLGHEGVPMVPVYETGTL